MNKTRYRIKDIGTNFGDAPFGTALKSKDYTPSGIPIIQGKNIVEQVFEWNHPLYTSEEKFMSLRRSHCNAGDLVFPKIGNRTVGSCAIAKPVEGYSTFLLSTNMMKMAVKPEIADIKYVYYYFCQPEIRQKIISEAGGGAQPIFNFTSLKNFEVELPPLPTQRRIAEILSAYDEMIENNIRRIRILERMAQSVYREWFGQASAESLPEGWELKTLGDVAENFDSKRVPLSSMKRAEMQGKFPYYGAAKVLDYVNDYIFDGKYLLIAEDGSVITTEGKPVLQMAYGKFWVNNHTHVLQGIAPISTEHLCLCLSNVSISGYITGAAQPKITQANLNRIPVIVPPDKLLTRFNKIFEETFDMIETLNRKNANLRRTRDMLLPRLVGGEVAVK